MSGKQLQFTPIRNFASTEDVAATLLRVSSCYRAGRGQWSEALHHQAREVVWPLAHYLQRRATQEQTYEMAGKIATGHTDVIEMLGAGILHTFLQECETLKIRSTDYLHVIKAVHVVLMEWACNEAMQEVLVRCAIISLLFKELHVLTRSLHIDSESDKFVCHMIQAASMTISSCVQDFCDLFMMLHPDTEVDACLRPYFKNPDVVVQAATRLSWIQFAPYLALKDPSIIDSSDDTHLYLKLLWSAVNKPQLMATHLGIMIDAAEILGTLRLLCVVKSNRDILMSSDIFPKSVCKAMSCDNCEALLAMLNLLLGLISPLMDDFKSKLARANQGKGKKSSDSSKMSCSEKQSHEYSWQSMLVSRIPELSDKLCPLESSSQQKVQNLASTLAWILKTDLSKISDGELSECASCVCSCLENKHYQLSLEICIHALRSTDKRDLHSLALDQLSFYQAKALFGIYSREQVLLQTLEKQISRQDFIILWKDIFSKPRKIAGSLGALLNEGSLDAEARKEMEWLLDTTLVDLVREVNCKSNQQVRQLTADEEVHGKTKSGRSAFYCLLCHCYDSLARGHMFPNSMLKATQIRKRQLKCSTPDLDGNDGGKEDKLLGACGVDTNFSTSVCLNTTPSSDDGGSKGLKVAPASLQETSVPSALFDKPKERATSSSIAKEESNFQNHGYLGMASNGAKQFGTLPSVGSEDEEDMASSVVNWKAKELETIVNFSGKGEELESSPNIGSKGKEYRATPIIGGTGTDDAQSVAGGKLNTKKFSRGGGKKQTYSSESQKDQKFFVKTRSNLSKKPKLKSTDETVFYMFCDHCDNEVLSRDEKVFAEQILAQTYSDTLPGFECLNHELNYDDALYRFCVGLILRALTLQSGVSKCTNSAHIYHIFKQCRAVLNAVEGRGSGCGADEDNLPQVAMFFTPATEPLTVIAEPDQGNAGVERSVASMKYDKPKSTTANAKELVSTAPVDAAMEIQVSLPSMARPASEKPPQLDSDPFASEQADDSEVDSILSHFLTSNSFSKLSYTPLLDSSPGVLRKGQFLLVHCGIFSVVLLIEPVPSLPTRYGQFLINPKGGCLHVPINYLRLSSIPPGVRAMYRESAAIATKNMLEMPKTLGPAKDVFNKVRYVRIDHTDDGTSPFQALKGMAYLPNSVSLLPAQYCVDFRTNSVILPAGDRIILHATDHPDDEGGIGFTVLLVVSPSCGGKGKYEAYCIVCQFSTDSNLCLGFYIDTSNERYEFQSFLRESYSKMILEELKERGHYLLAIPDILLPQALSDAGISSFEYLLTHSLRGRYSLDRKCRPGEGCWYCYHCCEICMESFVPGFLMRVELEGTASTDLHFCGQDCYSIGEHRLDSPAVSELKAEASSRSDKVEMCEQRADISLNDVDSMIHRFSVCKLSEEDPDRLAIVRTASCLYEDPEGVLSRVSINFYHSPVENTSSGEASVLGLFHIRSYYQQIVGEIKTNDQMELECVQKGSTIEDDPVIAGMLRHMVTKCLKQPGFENLQKLIKPSTAEKGCISR